MSPEPLSKAIYEAAKAAGVKKITLEFYGGDDEGHLNVSTYPYLPKLEQEILDWAWSAYSYSGAGDGSDYGDNITYDFETNTVTTSEWFMKRTETPEESSTMTIEKE